MRIRLTQNAGSAVLTALCLACLCLSACAKVPYTNRTQLNMIPPAKDAAIGAATADQILKKSTLSQDPDMNAIVKRVGSRIAAVADMPSGDWRFYVVVDETPNAFCLPGGKVFVNTGLFSVAKNEDQLAAVLGHEVGHVIARHGAERRSQLILAGTLGAVLAGAAGAAARDADAGQGVYDIYSTLAALGVLLPASRAHEAEADRIGIILMAKAGYPPEAAADFWRNMIRDDKEKKKKAVPTIFSTHPSDPQRVATIEKYLAEARSYATSPAPTDWGTITPTAYRPLGKSDFD